MSRRMQMSFKPYLIKLFIQEQYGINFLHFVNGDVFETILSGMCDD
jgi:hypothetical protein